MTAETSLGAGQSRFPSTVWDLLSITPGAPATDLNAVVERYWRPCYKFIRQVWKKSIEDSKDLTQDFFGSVFDRDFIQSADRTRGNFRKFLVTALRNFLTDRQRATNALKRGGGAMTFSLHPGPDEESLDPAAPSDPEAAFDYAWAAEIVRRGVARLEAMCTATGRDVRFKVFSRYCLDESEAPSYKEVADQLGLQEHDVRNHLMLARQELRAICTQFIMETVRDPGEIEAEMALLFGRRL